MGFMDNFSESIDEIEEGVENIIDKGEDLLNKI